MQEQALLILEQSRGLTMIPPPDLWGSTYIANNNKDVEDTEEGWSKVCSARSQEVGRSRCRSRSRSKINYFKH